MNRIENTIYIHIISTEILKFLQMADSSVLKTSTALPAKSKHDKTCEEIPRTSYGLIGS